MTLEKLAAAIILTIILVAGTALAIASGYFGLMRLSNLERITSDPAYFGVAVLQLLAIPLLARAMIYLVQAFVRLLE